MLGVAGAEAVEPVTGGADTAIWRVERAGAASALRVFRSDQVETCQREVAAMRAAVAAGLPIPAVQAEGMWRDRPALLLSWCAGRPLANELRSHPWRAWPLGVAFGRMQARLHTVPAPERLRQEPHGWSAWAGPGEEPLQARLRELAGEAAALLHLDYHALNVMTDGRRITGVLDWANAHAGDPRADLARTLTILRLAPLRPGTPRRRAMALRRMLEVGWRRGYRLEAGPWRDVPIFFAWAGAMMLHDLAPRVGKPGTGILPIHMERIRRWTERWKRRSGIA
jgi:aminoglycoside phosphotransferase (APT) family kinase protein